MSESLVSKTLSGVFDDALRSCPENVFSIRKNVWGNIIFFSITTFIGVFITPIYAYQHGLALFDWLLFLFYTAATGLSITVGYHRLFAHATFKASPIVRFFVLFFGAAAFEQSALYWASQHRDHHTYVDTDRDPYSIKKGFFYAHLGWLIFWKHKTSYDNVKDLQKDSLLMNQYKYYLVWAFGAGIITPVLIGALTGHAMGALLLGVCTRLTFVYHATFCINSVCHMFGKSTYDPHSSAKDNWFTAVFTYGEGFHNFHHRFPSDYRNGIRWFHWDPSKWMIAILSRLGLAWDLKKVSNFRILEARLVAQNQIVQEWLRKRTQMPQWQDVVSKFHVQYEKLRQTLLDWEYSAKEYQTIVCQRISRQSEQIRQNARQQMLDTRQQFHEYLTQWHQLHVEVLGFSY